MAWALVACLGAAQAQSPAEKLRLIHEAAQDSLLKEREAASNAIARLKKDAEGALVGWLQRGNGARSGIALGRGPQERMSQFDQEEVEQEEEAPPEGKNTATQTSASETRARTSPKEKPAEAGKTDNAVPAPRRQAAAPYRLLIGHYARRRDLPRTLLYAIADAESFFDADARSSAGAVGLMQVHPPTGGRLAWAAVHGEPHTPSKKHLEEPENNVRLATKLLELLLRDFFGGVKSKWSRQLLATASYNAGAGRVAGGLTPSGTIEAAAELANRLSPQEVYERLRRTAPPETQTYVRRVFRRREHYAPWRGRGEVYGVPGRDRPE